MAKINPLIPLIDVQQQEQPTSKSSERLISLGTIRGEVPYSGAKYANIFAKGCIIQDLDNGDAYIMSGEVANPSWEGVGAGGGAGTPGKDAAEIVAARFEDEDMVFEKDDNTQFSIPEALYQLRGPEGPAGSPDLVAEELTTEKASQVMDFVNFSFLWIYRGSSSVDILLKHSNDAFIAVGYVFRLLTLIPGGITITAPEGVTLRFIDNDGNITSATSCQINGFTEMMKFGENEWLVTSGSVVA